MAVETQLASRAIVGMYETEGIFAPTNFSRAAYFFAIDNGDFLEDTVDGENTLHGTAINIYQRGMKAMQSFFMW